MLKRFVVLCLRCIICCKLEGYVEILNGSGITGQNKITNCTQFIQQINRN